MSNASWVDTLRDACAAASQKAVASAIRQDDGYPSDALVNQVIQGRYGREPKRLKAIVEGYYLARTVSCPILGELRVDVCTSHQARPFQSTNPIRVRLYRACRSCPHAIHREDAA